MFFLVLNKNLEIRIFPKTEPMSFPVPEFLDAIKSSPDLIKKNESSLLFLIKKTLTRTSYITTICPPYLHL